MSGLRGWSSNRGKESLGGAEGRSARNFEVLPSDGGSSETDCHFRGVGMANGA